MKRLLCLIGLIPLIAFLVSCNNKPLGPVSDGNSSRSLNVILEKRTEGKAITRISVIITGDDFVPIMQDFTPTTDVGLVVDAEIEVPVGTNRLISVIGYDGFSLPAYVGESYFDLPAGDTPFDLELTLTNSTIQVPN